MLWPILGWSFVLATARGVAPLYEAIWMDAMPLKDERLHLLQSASPLPLHSGKAALASLDYSGLATLEFQVEQVEKIRSDHRLKGKLLEEAAMQAAAWAVAEETAAAKAAGGGSASALLASTGRTSKRTRSSWHADRLSQVETAGRFEVDSSNTSHANNSAHAANGSAAAVPGNKEGINPFNPFTNPFFNPFTPNPYAPMHAGGGGFKTGNVLLFVFLVVLAVAFGAITIGGIMEDDDESSGDDSSSFGYLNRLDKAKKLTSDERKRNCSSCFTCFGCRCSSTVVTFTIVAVFVTVLGGKILWNCGILQPLLAQLLLYAYVILIIFGFVAVVTHELTRKVRTMLRGLSQNLSDVTDVMPGFIRRKGNNSPRF